MQPDTDLAVKPVTTPVERPATLRERQLATLIFGELRCRHEAPDAAYETIINTLRARPLDATQQDKPANQTRATSDAIPEGARDEFMTSAFEAQCGVSNALRMENIRLRGQVTQLNSELAAFKAGMKGGC